MGYCDDCGAVVRWYRVMGLWEHATHLVHGECPDTGLLEQLSHRRVENFVPARNIQGHITARIPTRNPIYVGWVTKTENGGLPSLGYRYS